MKPDTAGAFPALDMDKCGKCHECVEACPRQAILEPLTSICSKCIKYCISMTVPCAPDYVTVCRDLCNGCGLCIDACPHGALYWKEGVE